MFSETFVLRVGKTVLCSERLNSGSFLGQVNRCVIMINHNNFLCVWMKKCIYKGKFLLNFTGRMTVTNKSNAKESRVLSLYQTTNILIGPT